MKIRTGELHTLNDLIRDSRSFDDTFVKEKLNQFMEDLRTKYHLSINDCVELQSGIILKNTESEEFGR